MYSNKNNSQPHSKMSTTLNMNEQQIPAMDEYTLEVMLEEAQEAVMVLRAEQEAHEYAEDAAIDAYYEAYAVAYYTPELRASEAQRLERMAEQRAVEDEIRALEAAAEEDLALQLEFEDAFEAAVLVQSFSDVPQMRCIGG